MRSQPVERVLTHQSHLASTRCRTSVGSLHTRSDVTAYAAHQQDRNQLNNLLGVHTVAGVVKASTDLVRLPTRRKDEIFSGLHQFFELKREHLAMERFSNLPI